MYGIASITSYRFLYWQYILDERANLKSIIQDEYQTKLHCCGRWDYYSDNVGYKLRKSLWGQNEKIYNTVGTVSNSNKKRDTERGKNDNACADIHDRTFSGLLQTLHYKVAELILTILLSEEKRSCK